MKNTFKVCALIIALVLMNVLSLTVFAAPTVEINVVQDLNDYYKKGDDIVVKVNLNENPGIEMFALQVAYDKNLLDCKYDFNFVYADGNPDYSSSTASGINMMGRGEIDKPLIVTITFTLKDAAMSKNTVEFTIKNFDADPGGYTCAPFTGIIKIEKPMPKIVIGTLQNLNNEYKEGDKIEATVSLENNPGVTSFSMQLAYDESLLECAFDFDGWEPMGGSKSVIVYHLVGVNEDKLLGKVTFTLKPGAGKETTIPFVIKVYQIANDDKDVDFIGAPFTGIIKIKKPPEPKYGITLAPASMSFTATVGYAATAISPNESTATVTNIGDQATGILDVTKSGNTGMFYFGILEGKDTIDSIAVNGTATFIVRPVIGLGVGTHTASVKIKGEGIEEKTLNITFTVTPTTTNPTNPTNPPSPPPPPIDGGGGDDGGGGGGGNTTPSATQAPSGAVNTIQPTTTAEVVTPIDEPTSATPVQPATQPTIASTTAAPTTIPVAIPDATIPMINFPTAPAQETTIGEPEEEITNATVPKGSFAEETTTEGKKSNPPTGANILAWTLITMAMFASAATILYFKKRPNKN